MVYSEQATRMNTKSRTVLEPMSPEEADCAVVLAKAEAYVFRAPIAKPLRTSFGTMFDRPSVLVRLEDRDGEVGWGEVWCNFPSCGAEHRARLIIEVLMPLLSEYALIDPVRGSTLLSEKTHILNIQCGEPGPLAQAIAGIDIALWDLVARKKGKPLYQLFCDRTVETVPVYASGINPNDPEKTVDECREKGHRAFKLKVGFGQELDLRNILKVAEGLRSHEILMVDANQAWTLTQALRFTSLTADLPVHWIEEPLPADRPAAEWAALASAAGPPLAAGENIYGQASFADVIAAGHIGVFQPDVCKWGGVSGCLQVARSVLRAGKRYCPHYLGGGIGLAASAHLLAAAGGDGLLEVDVNPNPLRSLLAMPHPGINGGQFAIPKAPGLGLSPDWEAARPYLVASHRFG